MMDEQDERKRELAEFLNARDPEAFHPRGTALFEALARWTVTVAFETVALRRGVDGRVEVFMTQRGPEEAYAGEWHSPGSALRPGEIEQNVFDRLVEREFGTSFLSPPRMVGIHNYLKEARGHFYCPVYLVEIGETDRGQWFPVGALPENTIVHHREQVIPIALSAFTG